MRYFKLTMCCPFSKIVRLLGLLTLTVIFGNVQAKFVHGSHAHYETSVVEIMQSLKSGDLTETLQLADQHLASFPRSKLVHLIKADALRAMSGELANFKPSDKERAEELEGLRHQARNRWLHDEEQHVQATTRLPASILDMGQHKYVLLADLKFGRLYLYGNDNGTPSLVRDYYLSVGSAGFGKEVEGDNKTPVGIYKINSHIEGKKLPDLYGKGAYPVDYPNRYDRALKRTGYGIWLHGTPSDTYARAPWSSEGCFVLSNNDLLDIEQYLDVPAHPPVILSDAVEWIDAAEHEQRRADYLAIVQAWQRDWENLDMDAYLAHYSRENLNFGSEAFDPWARHKIDVNQRKAFVQIDLDVQSLFVYPDQKDMFVVKFKQRYLSDNFAAESDKELFWQRDAAGNWKIIFEG